MSPTLPLFPWSSVRNGVGDFSTRVDPPLWHTFLSGPFLCTGSRFIFVAERNCEQTGKGVVHRLSRR